MIYLLDANAWIGWLRKKHAKLVARIKQEDPANINLCSMVLGELNYGAERSGAAYRTGNLHQIEQLRRQYSSIPFDDRAAEEYGRIRAFLAASGQLIGPNDLIIAAIALANDLTVVTNNTFEFNRVPRLKVVDWQT